MPDGEVLAQVLRGRCRLKVFGRHEDKLRRLREVETSTELPRGQFDVVIEASGTQRGFEQALDLVRPRGTLVLKSTVAAGTALDMARVVIDEVAAVGSRCGPFEPAIRALGSRAVDPRSMIDAVMPLSAGVDAFSRAEQPGVLKVLLDARR